MNMLQTIQTTMSSREISELVESRHDNVKRSMETLRDGGLISFQQAMQQSHVGSGSRPVLVYLVSKRDSLITVAQLDLSKLGAMLDAWGKTESDLQAVLSALDAFEVPEECADMYVYAIRNTTTGNIKLGISRNPEQRLKQLQTGNDCALELVACIKAENRFQDETALHHAHAAAHIRGEWFDQSAAFAIAQ